MLRLSLLPLHAIRYDIIDATLPLCRFAIASAIFIAYTPRYANMMPLPLSMLIRCRFTADII